MRVIQNLLYCIIVLTLLVVGGKLAISILALYVIARVLIGILTD